MDIEQLTQQLRQVMHVTGELRDQNASLVLMNEQLRNDNAALRHDFETLLASTQTLIEARDKLQERVTELESVNKGLVGMLWGRRSERRSGSPDQMSLDFGDPEETPSDEEQGVITAQQQADEALDQRILRDAEAATANARVSR